MDVSIGVIEGFYGRPYCWAERRELIEFLAREGFDHYWYAPKADVHLRACWAEQHASEEAAELRSCGVLCKRLGVAWGVGMSPPSEGDRGVQALQEQLLPRVEQLLGLAIERLALLFDDVHGHPQLAANQCALAHAVRRRFPELRLALCPTYYTTSSILDRLFGDRPPDYLRQLGQDLDPAVDVFWTGPEVCSQQYPNEHLEEVGALLRRRPWIWDNYPVNDGARMFRFLRLRGFPPRTRDLAERVAGVSANPMSQPWLSRIPLASLPAALKRDIPTDPEEAFREHARRLLPAPLFEQLARDHARFQDGGLDSLTPAEADELVRSYRAFAHPAAHEVVRWLSRETEIGDEFPQ